MCERTTRKGAAPDRPAGGVLSERYPFTRRAYCLAPHAVFGECTLPAGHQGPHWNPAAFETWGPDGGFCACCGTLCDAHRLQPAVALGGDACETCREIARKVVAQFVADARKAWREVRAQLPQIVADVRAGAESPTYYRGFE